MCSVSIFYGQFLVPKHVLMSLEPKFCHFGTLSLLCYDQESFIGTKVGVVMPACDRGLCTFSYISSEVSKIE
jgi:hypothetical protein